LESRLTEQQLFDQLISSLVHSAWIAMGKLTSPITGEVERDLGQASIHIDMLDMLFKRMDGNLSASEEQYLTSILAELKVNYLEEKRKEEAGNTDSSDSETTADAGGTANKETEDSES
jgi:hypothetical protein